MEWYAMSTRRNATATTAPVHGLSAALALLVTLLAIVALSPPAAALPEASYRELAPTPLGAPPSGFFGVELVQDDGSAEGAFGVGGLAARQFLWFQVFDAPRDYDLEQIWVLFPDDPEIGPGASIQLVVYQDQDADPASGAELLLLRDDTVQVADGSTFSVYTLAEPLVLRDGGTTLIGVINRFVTSGLSPSSQPAALDTGASRQRSWVAVWSGDPPPVPELPPDDSLFLIDDFVEGNWMIRGFGSDAVVVEVPVLEGWASLFLVLLLAAVAVRQIAAR